jgi:cytochrome P450
MMQFDGFQDVTLWIVTAVLGGAILYMYQKVFASHGGPNQLGLSYPPEPPGKHWLWGHGKLLPRDGSHYDVEFLKMAQDMNNASVFALTLPVVKKMIIVADPDLVHHITVSQNYDKSWTYERLIFGPQSIVRTHGDEWLAMRKAFVGGFTPNYLKEMVSTMSTKLERLLNCLDVEADKERPSHMMLRAQIFTSDVIVQVALGEDWGDAYNESPEFMDNFEIFMKYTNRQRSKLTEARTYFIEMSYLSSALTNDPMTAVFGFGERKRMREINNDINQIFGDVLERRLADLQAADKKKSKKGERKDICTLAIEAINTTESTATLTAPEKESIIEQLKTFYFAGNDTTATTIAWATWLLSQHPEVVKTLRKELDQKKIFRSLKSGDEIGSVERSGPSYEDLNNCPYLDAVIKETLRLYPPASTARYVADPNESYNKEYKLGGAVLYINPYVMHRLPQYWEQPNDFLPDRFMGVSPDTYAHKFVPFSKGKRDCLGKYFAMLEAKLAVAALIQRYDMRCLDEDEKIGYRITSYPMGGAKVYLSKRSK